MGPPKTEGYLHANDHKKTINRTCPRDRKMKGDIKERVSRSSELAGFFLVLWLFGGSGKGGTFHVSGRVDHAIDRRSTKIGARACTCHRNQVKDEPSSIKLERPVLEAKGLRSVTFHLAVMVVMMMVTMIRVFIFGFGHAAVAVGRWHETVEAVADGALAPLARDVGDVRDRAAVPALGGVSGEGNRASTTYNQSQKRRIVSHFVQNRRTR